MKKRAFTLIEILIVLTIIGLVSALILPAILKPSASKERLQFISNLNGLLHLAWKQSINYQKSSKIIFNFTTQTVSIEEEIVTENNELIYRKIMSETIKTTINIPDIITFKKFLIEGFDEMSRFVRGTTNELWFFVSAKGIAQHVSFSITKTGTNLDRQKDNTEYIYDIHPLTLYIKERL